VHLHSRPEDAAEKVTAAYEAGCRRFDGALTGLGGCPFAGDELVGNIPTETVLGTLAARGVNTGVTAAALEPVIQLTQRIRREYSSAEVIQ
jgi:hydroxymethylglutaryl-CoA lyase